MRKSAEEANFLIEDLANSNYRAPSATSGSNIRLRGGGVIELNRMSSIKAKMDELMSKMGHQEKRVHSGHEVGTVEGGEQKCIADERLTREGPNEYKTHLFLSPFFKYISGLKVQFKEKLWSFHPNSCFTGT